MGCCGKQRQRFVVKVQKAKAPTEQPLTSIPDEELTPRQLRIKNRDLRIAERHIRENRILTNKALQDRKALNN